MTLAARLSAFFLATLALVLFGFSSSLYLLARAHLHRQLDERLESALGTLAAAAEVEADGIEWDLRGRQLAFPSEGPGAVRWAVYDERGGALSASQTAGASEDWLGEHSQAHADDSTPEQVTGPDGGAWRLAQRRLRAPQTSRDRPAKTDKEKKHPEVVLMVALPLGPMTAVLRNLALLLAGLSMGLWLLVALAGRWLARRALAPLTRMAGAARAMSAADLGERLPAPATGDELDDLGRAFNDLLARLHESFERQRRFTGDASHQLRTPLTAMLGQVEVALRRPRPAEDYREALDKVHKQAVHLRRLVEMLLFLARADAETRLPDLQALDLGPWLAEHVRGWPTRAGDLRLALSSSGPLLVEAHPALLGQLVDNLLENACKYSASGTPIALLCGEEKGAAVLAVEDAGCGLAPEDLPHLFEPFYRSEQARRLGIAGVGLGLAVARRIARALGGELTAEGRRGEGGRFVLRLPLVRG